MAKSFLRSGNLDAVLALGENGQPVYASALPLRETLRLRNQAKIADCLAIPQPDERGERIDWYAPFSGKVKSWIAASDSERTAAIHLLASYQSEVDAISQRAQSAQKPAMRLFGILLSKVFQFPDQNYLYLVDGKPVITFWGFVNLNENARDDVLACLREEAIPEPVITLVEPPEPEETPVVNFSQADEPLIAPTPVLKNEEVAGAVYEKPQPAPPVTPPPAPEPEPAPAPVVAPVAKKRSAALWLLPVAAMVVAAVAAPLLLKQQATPETSLANTPTPVATPAPVITPASPAPQLTASLPLHQADVVAVKTPVVEEKKSEPAVIAAIPKDVLVMDAIQVKTGNTRFLNGTWRVTPEIKDHATGKAPTLRYQIQNNKGTARLVQAGNITCRADLFSGLHQTGELMIKSRSNARCSDGSRYPMPEITCTAGSNDVAQCTARYDGNTVVPVTFRKTGA